MIWNAKKLLKAFLQRGCSKAVRKVIHHHKLLNHLKNNTQILIITADNLHANHVKAIRQRLRKESSFVMGKNTLLKRSIAIHAPAIGYNAFTGLVPYISGKVGLVFTVGDPEQVSEFVSSSYKLQPLVFVYGYWNGFALAVVVGYSF